MLAWLNTRPGGETRAVPVARTALEPLARIGSDDVEVVMRRIPKGAEPAPLLSGPLWSLHRIDAGQPILRADVLPADGVSLPPDPVAFVVSSSALLPPPAVFSPGDRVTIYSTRAGATAALNAILLRANPTERPVFAGRRSDVSRFAGLLTTPDLVVVRAVG